MKRIIPVGLLMMLLLSACSEHSKDYMNGYEEGYHNGHEVGYDDGYYDGQNNIDYDELSTDDLCETLTGRNYIVIPYGDDTEETLKEYLSEYGYEFNGGDENGE